MQLYSEVTPTITLLNNTKDLDILKSSYANLRYSVSVERVVTIDSAWEANLPGLAYAHYGDQEMWRAILAFNGLTDPINDIIAGVQIALPSRTSLDAFMATSSRNLNPTLTL